MSASTNFFSALLKMDIEISPMYECWGFGSSGKFILNSRGSSLAIGNMARSGGGWEYWREGRSAGKGGRNRIRSANARA